jgi:hypothetical protein
VNEGKEEIIIETMAHKNYSKMSWLDRIKEIDDRIGTYMMI